MDAFEQYRLDERLANALYYLWQGQEDKTRDASLGVFRKLVTVEKRSRGAAAPLLHMLYAFIHHNYEDARAELTSHDGLMRNLPKLDETVQKPQSQRSTRVARETESAAAFDAETIDRILDLGDIVDWILDPIAPGDWQSATQDEEPVLRALAASHLRDVLDVIEGMRCLRPSFYEGVLLVEVQMALKTGQHIASFYVTDTHTALFNGAADVVHELNAAGHLNITDQTVLDYLKFFCLAIQGDDGPFRIVTHGSEIPGWEFLSADTKRVVEEAAMEPVAGRDIENADSYRVPACVKYSHSLFHTDFRVSKNGTVEMLNDEIVLQGINFTPEHFGPQGLRTLVRLKA